MLRKMKVMVNIDIHENKDKKHFSYYQIYLFTYRFKV